MPQIPTLRLLSAIVSLPLTATIACTAARSSSEPRAPLAPQTVPHREPQRPGLAPLVQAETKPARVPSPRNIGKCQVQHEAGPIWNQPPANTAPPSAGVSYARFRQRKVIHVGHSHLSIAHFAPDAKSVLAVSESEAALRLYDVASGRLLAKHPVKGYEQFGRGDFEFFGADQPTQVLFAHDHGIELIDASSGQHLRQLSEQGAWEITWSDGHDVLLATLAELNTQTSRLALYTRTADGGLELALLLACPERIDGMALDAARRRLAMSHYPANEVSLLDLQTGAQIVRVQGPHYARSVALSPDGAQLAVGGSAVWLFGTSTPAHRNALYTRFDNNVHHLQFSPDGTVIAASAYDGRARLLEFVPGQPKLRLVRELRHAGTANVYAAEFSRDGRSLLTSSGDRTLRIWGE